MILAPVSQELGDFVELAAGSEVETLSLGDFQLLASEIPSTPYRVNIRGSDAFASELMYESILWADRTYLTDYRPDASIHLYPVGDVEELQTVHDFLGRFGQTTELLSASVSLIDDEITLELCWVGAAVSTPHRYHFCSFL